MITFVEIMYFLMAGAIGLIALWQFMKGKDVWEAISLLIVGAPFIMRAFQIK